MKPFDVFSQSVFAPEPQAQFTRESNVLCEPLTTSLAGIEVYSDDLGFLHAFDPSESVSLLDSADLHALPSSVASKYTDCLRRFGAEISLRDSVTGETKRLSETGSERLGNLGNNTALDGLIDLLLTTLASMPNVQCTGIAKGTRIATPDGHVCVEHIRPGQKLRSPNNKESTVLGVARIPISEVVLRCLPMLQPIVFSPRSTLCGQHTHLAPAQAVQLSGHHVDYEFGEAEVFVEAHEFKSQARTEQKDHVGSLSYYHLILDRPEVVQTDIHWVESLCGHSLSVGWLNRMKQMGRLRTLNGIDPDMMQYVSPDRLRLRRFEAQTLLAEMSR
ncbi:MAG: Hint domain-containing protein [Pseudoruegeria sp.]